MKCLQNAHPEQCPTHDEPSVKGALLPLLCDTGSKNSGLKEVGWKQLSHSMKLDAVQPLHRAAGAHAAITQVQPTSGSPAGVCPLPPHLDVFNQLKATSKL